MNTNFLEVETPLLERLRTEVPDMAQRVYGAADLAGIEEQAQFAPSLQVFYRGLSVRATQGDDECPTAQCDLLWSVVVVVNNASATEQGEEVRAEAGPLMRHVLRVLQGFTPARGHGPLAVMTSPAPLIRAGFGYFPLYFKTSIVVSGDGTV